VTLPASTGARGDLSRSPTVVRGHSRSCAGTRSFRQGVRPEWNFAATRTLACDRRPIRREFREWMIPRDSTGGVYEPTSLTVDRRSDPRADATWQQRVEQAERTNRDQADPRQSIRRALPEEVDREGLRGHRRSWALRRIPRYREEGFEALIDARTREEARFDGCRQQVKPRVKRSAADGRMKRWNPAQAADQRCRLPRDQRSFSESRAGQVRAPKGEQQGRTRGRRVATLRWRVCSRGRDGTVDRGADREVLRIARMRSGPAGRRRRRMSWPHYRRTVHRHTLAPSPQARRAVASYLRTAEEMPKDASIVARLRARAVPRRSTPKLQMCVLLMVAVQQGVGCAPLPPDLCRPGLAHAARTCLRRWPSSFVALDLGRRNSPLIEATALRCTARSSSGASTGHEAALYIDTSALRSLSSLVTQSGQGVSIISVIAVHHHAYAHSGAAPGCAVVAKRIGAAGAALDRPCFRASGTRARDDASARFVIGCKRLYVRSARVVREGHGC